MADEDRFDRLENQMGEMLSLMGKLIGDFAEQRKDLNNLTGDFTEQRKDLNNLTNNLNNLTSNFNQHRREFADVVTVVIATEKKVESLDQKLGDFQDETRTNFERIFRESNITNRRVDVLTPTVSEVQIRVQELEKRMEKVEHQIAV